MTASERKAYPTGPITVPIRRAYPVTWPDDDRRFSGELLDDVRKVLEAHDYPSAEELDLLDLQNALRWFIYGVEIYGHGVRRAGE